MLPRNLFLTACLCISSVLYSQQKTTQSIYFPPPQLWETRQPAQLGMNPGKINEAIAIAKAAESKNPRNMEISHYQSFGKEPFGEAIGPFAERGEPTGLIIYKGYIIASWGDPSVAI